MTTLVTKSFYIHNIEYITTHHFMINKQNLPQAVGKAQSVWTGAGPRYLYITIWTRWYLRFIQNITLSVAKISDNNQIFTVVQTALSISMITSQRLYVLAYGMAAHP